MLHRRSTTRVALGPRRRPTAPISARRRGHRAQSAARVHTATRPRRDRIDKTPKTTSPRRNPSPTPCARRTRRAASRPRASPRHLRSLRVVKPTSAMSVDGCWCHACFARFRSIRARVDATRRWSARARRTITSATTTRLLTHRNRATPLRRGASVELIVISRRDATEHRARRTSCAEDGRWATRCEV